MKRKITISYWIIPCMAKYIPKKDYEVEQIIKVVDDVLGIKREVLMSKSRKAEIVHARFIVMWILRKGRQMTLGKIGYHFGKDHTTILNAVRMADNLIETENEVFINNLQAVKKKL